jgi:hypothetical protein
MIEVKLWQLTHNHFCTSSVGFDSKKAPEGA